MWNVCVILTMSLTMYLDALNETEHKQSGYRLPFGNGANDSHDYKLYNL